MTVISYNLKKVNISTYYILCIYIFFALKSWLLNFFFWNNHDFNAKNVYAYKFVCDKQCELWNKHHPNLKYRERHASKVRSLIEENMTTT